jgi:hypothetical protein
MKYRILFTLIALLTPDFANAQRQVFAVFPPMSYYYIVLYNPSTVNQTVTVTYRSTGLNLEAGGFPLAWAYTLPDIGGFYAAQQGNPSAGGVGGDGMQCTTATTCVNRVTYRTLAPGGILRLGVGTARAAPSTPAPADYSGARPSVSTSSTIGVGLEVAVTEDAGFIVGSAYAYLDLSNGAVSVDTPFFVPLNAGRPF